jgi:hypothetical protein
MIRFAAFMKRGFVGVRIFPQNALVRVRLTSLLLVLFGLAISSCLRAGFDFSDGAAGDARRPDAPTDRTADTGAAIIDASADRDDASTVHKPAYLRTIAGPFSTSSTTFVEIPDGILTFTPRSTAEVWLLLLSAQLSSSLTDQISAEIRYTVNGVERGMGGMQNMAADRPAPWLHLHHVTATVEPQEVRVWLRVADGAYTAGVNNLRIVAFPLPSGVDFQFIGDDDTHAVPASVWTDFATLSFTPPAPGRYLIMSIVNGSEEPGEDNLGIRVLDPAGTVWPEGSNSGFINNRWNWTSFLFARVQQLEATPQTYRLQGHGASVSGSTLCYPRVMAFRLDAFEQAESVENLGWSQISSETPQVKSALQSSTPPGPRDHIIIQSMSVTGIGDDDPGLTRERVSEFTADGVVQTRYARVYNNGAPFTSDGLLDAVTVSGSVRYENAAYTTDASLPVNVNESVIHLLRLPPGDP